MSYSCNFKISSYKTDYIKKKKIITLRYLTLDKLHYICFNMNYIDYVL